MRLIDADALLKAVKSGMESGTLYLPIEFCDLIEKVPTADVEKPKGKWLPFLEEYHDMFKCSNCEDITRVPFKCISPPYYYCPNCGADMREEKADAEIY